MQSHDQEVRSVYFQFLGLGMVLLGICWMFTVLQNWEKRGPAPQEPAGDHWVMS